MFWIVLIIGVLGYILYNSFRHKDQVLKIQVDMQGGMAKKYEYIIDRLTKYPTAKVVKVTRDHIHIQSIDQSTITDFYITECYNSVQIKWEVRMAMLGKHNHKWSFVHNYPQDKIINEIEEYLEWNLKQMIGISTSSLIEPEQYVVYPKSEKNKEESLQRICSRFGCSNEDVRIKYLSKLLFQDKLSPASAVNLIEELKSNKVKDSSKFEINMDDTDSAIIEEWTKYYLDNKIYNYREKSNQEEGDDLRYEIPNVDKLIESNDLSDELLSHILRVSSIKEDPVQGIFNDALNIYESNPQLAIDLISIGLMMNDNNIKSNFLSLRSECFLLTNKLELASSDVTLAIEGVINAGKINESLLDNLYAQRSKILNLMNGGFALVKRDDKFGYVDGLRNERIPFIFDDADEFEDGLARVRIDNKYFLINQKGEYVFQFKYEEVSSFNDGIARVKLLDKYGFIDRSVNEIIPLIYELTSLEFKEGLAYVYNNRKCGFIDKNGTLVIPYKYDECSNFVHGLAWVTLNGKSGYINENGIEVIPLIFDTIYPWDDNLKKALKEYRDLHPCYQ